MVGSVAAQKTGAGGAAAGCLYWTECKTQLNVRCMEYATMAIVSIIAMIFQLIGVGALLCVPVMMNSEDGAGKEKKGSKKEKAKKGALMSTMICAILGFVSAPQGIEACAKAAALRLPFLSWTMYMVSGAYSIRAKEWWQQVFRHDVLELEDQRVWRRENRVQTLLLRAYVYAGAYVGSFLAVAGWFLGLIGRALRF